MDPRIQKIKDIFATIDPNTELTVEDHGDGSCTVVGPFPSFMILVQPDNVARALIHVNADAPNMAMIFSVFLSQGIVVEFDGGFAINGDTGKLLLNQEAYRKKEDNILMFANEIYSRRTREKNVASIDREFIMPDEKKIIIAS